jgi:hypothetical protein
MSGPLRAAQPGAPTMNWLIQHGKRLLRITAGLLLMLIGVILMLPGVPGPGFVPLLIGLSLLAADFEWARRLRERIMAQARKLRDKARGRQS